MFQFLLHDNCFQRRPQAERLMCTGIRGMQLCHYTSCCTYFTHLGDAANYLPKNASHTLEQACRHKWHTIKVRLILGFFPLVGGDVAHTHMRMLCVRHEGMKEVKEFKNKARRDKQKQKLAGAHFLKLWVKTQETEETRGKKNPCAADISGVSWWWWWWWCRLSQIKVWCNCYKGSIFSSEAFGWDETQRERN